MAQHLHLVLLFDAPTGAPSQKPKREKGASVATSSRNTSPPTAVFRVNPSAIQNQRSDVTVEPRTFSCDFRFCC
jgi:hypothetical protein